MKTKICTTIEQSKKLVELGIDVNTADMHWMNEILFLSFEKGDKTWSDKLGYEYLPAWSLSGLLNLIPKVESVGYEQYPILEHDDEGYGMSSPIYNTDYYSNPLDATFEMVCWLKENGKI